MADETIQVAANGWLPKVALKAVDDVEGVRPNILPHQRERKAAAPRENLNEELAAQPPRNVPLAQTPKRARKLSSISRALDSSVGDTFTSSDWSHVLFS